MVFEPFDPQMTDRIVSHFTAVFGASEGEAEGQQIGALVSNLIATTAPGDLYGYVARSEQAVVGAIFFSRLWLEGGEPAFILSPVAIATQHQGRGIGQKLIRYGIARLTEQGAALLFTYGDPQFYTRLGFQPVDPVQVPAPQPLSYPHGWVAQSLTGGSVGPFSAPVRCVDALNKPEYW